jgi:hypothetical protein
MRIDIGMVWFVSSGFLATRTKSSPFIGMYSEMPSEITLSCKSLCTIGKTADKRSDHDIMPRTDSVTIVDELFDGIIDIGIIRRSR